MIIILESIWIFSLEKKLNDSLYDLVFEGPQNFKVIIICYKERGSRWYRGSKFVGVWARNDVLPKFCTIYKLFGSYPTIEPLLRF